MTNFEITFTPTERDITWDTYQDALILIGHLVMQNNGMPPYDMSAQIEMAQNFRTVWLSINDIQDGRA